MSNKITWLILISLTVIGFIFSETSFLGAGMAVSILLLYAVKFLGIGFQFMEISKAHFIWKTILVSILLVFITFIGFAFTI